MEIRADALVSFPRPLVFATYRDHVVELVPHLPNIRAIEVRERVDEGAVVRVVSVWHGGGDIPTAARTFLSEAMLSWTDHARWDEDAYTVTWRIEPHAFTEAVRCEGVNRFIEAGEGCTRVEIRGGLTVDAAEVRGVPRLLAKRVSRIAEERLVAHITPNLATASQGVERHLMDARNPR